MQDFLSRSLHCSLGAGVVLLLLTGCGSHPATGQVSGVVTYDGEPLPYADIRFIPDPLGPRGAIAKTDQAGRYRLMYSVDRAGVIPGNYRVVISTRGGGPDASGVPESAGSSDNPYESEPSSMTAGAGREMLPMRYASSRETVLAAEVVEGDNSLDFHLEKD